jgi:hypothetical protein
VSRSSPCCKTKSHGVNPGFNLCRVDWIRTSDLLHPMQTRYFD